jgi:hypothetical protein
MNGFVASLLGILVAGLSPLAARDLPPLQAKALRLMGAGHRLSSAEMETILGSDRDAILVLLKKIAGSSVTGDVTEFVYTDGSTTEPIPTQARMVLLRLPDPDVLETIGNQLAEYRLVSRYGSLLDGLFGEAVRSKQPKLLPYIAKGMFRTEDTATRDFQLASPWKINRSVESLMCLMQLTEAVDEFSAGVRGWARAMRGAHHLSNDEKREIGRTWWKDNEQAILAGQYAGVRPGISPAEGLPRSKARVLADPGDAKRVLPVQAHGASPAENSRSTVLGSAGTTQAEGRSWQAYLWAGLAAMVAGAAGWVFLRCRGKTGQK